MKKVKVSFDFICGEFSNNSEVILTVHKTAEQAIHKYFNDFYGKGNTDNGMTEKGRKYFYHGCQVCVKVSGYETIKEDTWCSRCKRNKTCPLYANILANVKSCNSDLRTPNVNTYFEDRAPEFVMYVEECKKFVDMY